MKKISLLFLVILIFMNLAPSVFAQGRELEIEYPEVEGYQPEQVTTPVPEYVKYIFNFFIGIAGVLALGVLIYGGFLWFTSAGSPEKIREAKDRIGAALLGLLILFGSYLILISINPDLVVFHLKRLRPIISELPAGVLVCKEQPKTADGNDAVKRARQLTVDFKYVQEYERQKQMKKELDSLLDDIALKCYTVPGAGNIMPAFENKVTDIYFIPSPPAQKAGRIVQYGAALYEERNYESDSNIYYTHFEKPGATIYDIEHKELINFQLSSIKPFTLIWPPDPSANVKLYQETNYNKDVGGMGVVYSIGSSLYGPYPNIANDLGGTSPKSIKIEGDLLVFLIAEDPKTGDDKSEMFFAEDDSNLEDDENIVKWVDCKDYQSGTSKQCTGGSGGAPMGGGATYTYQCCAQAAATRMIIISAKPY